MKNVLTKEAFAEWCEKQPAKRYNWHWTDTCAVGQYAQSLGFSGSTADFSIDTGLGNRPIEIAGLTVEMVVDEPHTFGALASRLRAEA